MQIAKYKYWIYLGIVLAGLLAIRAIFFPGQKALNTAAGPNPNQKVNVAVYIVKQEKLGTELYISGTLRGNETVNLSAETAGKVTGIYFQEGSYVQKGMLLVKLNDAELQANLKKIKAEEMIIDEKVNRLKRLLDIQGVSKEEYEMALNQQQSLEADAGIINTKIAQTEVRAPFSGFIGLKNISPGSFINPNANIAVLEQTNPIKLDFQIPEKYGNLLTKGSKVAFTVEGSSNVFSAEIFAIDPQISSETRSIQIRALCSNSNNILRPGAFANISLPLAQKGNVTVVPSQSVVPDMVGQKAFIIQNGKAVVKPVITGLRTDNKVEIISGLNIGDSVVISGLMQLKPGAIVNIIKQ